MRRRSGAVALAGLVVGVTIAAGVPLGWALTRPADRARPTTVGAATARALATAGPTSAATSPAPTRSAPQRNTSVPVPPRVPTAVVIPALGVRAGVIPVGVDARGAVAIPPDVRTLGWYRFGPRPGSTAGSAVIIGHVDSAAQGRGAFFTLGRLHPGDRLTVRAGGTSYGYRVVAREQWRKDRVPLSRIFSATGRPRLTLVTCGGPFDARSGSYLDNLAVTAIPERTG